MYTLIQYRKRRDRGEFSTTNPARELRFIEKVIDGGGLSKPEYNGLWRRRRTLKKRIEGKDARWRCGIKHGGGVPEHKKGEWGMRTILEQIWEVLEQ